MGFVETATSESPPSSPKEEASAGLDEGSDRSPNRLPPARGDERGTVLCPPF